MAWFAVNTRGVPPSEVLRMEPAETRALRRAASKLLQEESKAQFDRDLALAKVGGCAFRGGR